MALRMAWPTSNGKNQASLLCYWNKRGRFNGPASFRIGQCL